MTLSTAIELPEEDVTALLRGVAPEAGGESRILGSLHAQADPELRDHVANELSDDVPSPLLARLWAFSRLTAGGSVPTIALAAGLDDADLESITAALRRADLPRDLEALVLDADQTRTADTTWLDLRILRPT